MWLIECLAERMNKDGECWPSMPTISKDSGFSEPKVRRLIKELKKVKILSYKTRVQSSHKYKLPKGVTKYTPQQNEHPPTKRTGSQNEHHPPNKTNTTPLTKRTGEVLNIEVLNIEVLESKERELSLAHTEIKKLKQQVQELEQEKQQLLSKIQKQDQEKEKSCAKKEKAGKLTDKDRPATESRLYPEVMRVMNYLKAKANYQFREKKTKFSMDRYGPRLKIVHLLDNGADIMDFQKVIDIKTNEWSGSKKMARFLNPDTLFGPENFEKYLNQYYNTQNIKEDETNTNKQNRSDNTQAETAKQITELLRKPGTETLTNEFLDRWTKNRNNSNATRTA